MLSQEFLIQRGYCCGHGCLMCPYEPKHTEGSTVMKADEMKKTMNLFQIHEYVESLEKRVESLENILTDFMRQYGPDVQRRRAERDAVWDEMIRVLTIQKRRDA